MRILNRCVVLAIIFIIAAGLSGCGKGDGNAHPLNRNMDSGVDTDGDGTEDSADNCPDTANPEQTDTDADGRGDRCDDDDDNDGLEDLLDPAALDPAVCGDADGDTCDDCSVGNDGFGPLADNDAGNDGPDLDGDGTCDAGDDDPTNGRPLVHYKFNAQDGATIADHGLAQAPATLTGSVNATSDEEGHPGEAYALSGADSAIEVDNAGLSRIGERLDREFTIVMNCRIVTMISSSLLKITGSGGEHITISSLGNLLVLQMDLDGDGEKAFILGRMRFDAAASTINHWHHIALTYSEQTTKLYINGNAVGLSSAEDAAVFSLDSLSLLKGGSFSDNTAVSDFKIYDRSLAHGQIKALWNKLHVQFTLDRENTDDADADLPARTYSFAGQNWGTGFMDIYGATVHHFTPGMLTDARFALDQFQQAQGAIALDGTDDYLELDADLSAGLSNDTFSIAAWIKPGSMAGEGVIASRTADHGAATDGWRLMQTGNRIEFRVDGGGSSAVCTSPAIDANQWSAIHGGWIHVVAAWDGFSDRASLYINGALEGSDTLGRPMDATVHPILIGAQYNDQGNPGRFWTGGIDDVQFFNKALAIGPDHSALMADVPGVKQLFEDGYLARAYTDCAYPYLDCNPAVYDVPTAFETMATESAAKPIIAEDTDTYDYAFYNPPLLGVRWPNDCSHIQGSQRFLPPNDQWYVYSRSHTDGLYDAVGGISERILGIVDMSASTPNVSRREKRFDYDMISEGYTPSTHGHFDHGGGMQNIGQYLFVPLDTTCRTAVKTSRFYTAVYKIGDLVDDIDTNTTPVVHRLADPSGVPKGSSLGEYQADVFSSVARMATGQYLWIDAFYEANDAETQTDLFRFNISNEATLEYDPDFQTVLPSPGSAYAHIDIDDNTFCSIKNTNGGKCYNGNWNSGTLVSDTRGRLYFIMTNSFDRAVLLEVKIDKMGDDKVAAMEQEYDGQKNFAMSGTTFKAGAGGHVTADGVLSLFATEFYNDASNIQYTWFNVNLP